MEIVFRILGAFGLLLITTGVLTKSRINQNILFILGGMFLLAYSSWLQDPIFIPLQIIFIAAAIYELIKLEFKKKKH